MTRRRKWVSAFILTILGLQVVPVAREWTGAQETLWPFLAWGMYRHSSGPPVEAIRRRIVAVTANGNRLVGPADAGFERFAFRRFYQTPIAEGDSAAARDLRQRLARRWGAPVREIVVEETVFTVADDGLQAQTSLRRIESASR